MGAMRDYLLGDLWCYELPIDSISEKDLEVARSGYNLLTKEWMREECYIIGSFNNILSYLTEYIGVEPLINALTPLKKVYQ